MASLQNRKRFYFFVSIIVGCMIAVLSGCGSPYWYSTSKDAKAFQQDRYQCEAEAAKYSADMGKSGKKSLVEQRTIDCMKLRGYGRSDAGDVPQGAAKFEQ